MAFQKDRRDARREWLEHQHSNSARCFYCRNVTTLQPRNAKSKLGDIHATLDHFVPTAKGGKDVPANWRLACFTCNGLKGDRTASEFVAELIEAGVR